MVGAIGLPAQGISPVLCKYAQCPLSGLEWPLHQSAYGERAYGPLLQMFEDVSGGSLTPVGHAPSEAETHALVAAALAEATPGMPHSVSGASMAQSSAGVSSARLDSRHSGDGGPLGGGLKNVSAGSGVHWAVPACRMSVGTDGLHPSVHSCIPVVKPAGHCFVHVVDCYGGE